ncbi:hypothetical protein CU669_03190 [Paramagnetospirillum kuznetsovii]|uniref:Glycoside-hydrolase family GH114 TIM-barrel domain-containing protein n=1 Tax=Paramagnetospirillum kuznetsovii TaxID=2053833 RepID=A0A364P1F5_9PROT|nr:hypothetical protein [Paramagnetospirillum kuznetsovii]RAU23179.1 hypothetical protein CU669_03190 [Paramagnetospirillum kuznetsovii]
MRRGLLGGILALTLALASPALALDKPRDFVPPPMERIPNFRDQTRDVILELARYAKKRSPNFQVMMRGGSELLVKGEIEVEWEDIRDPQGTNFIKRLPLRATYRQLVQTLDAIVVDGLYCGPYKFDKPLAELVKARRDLDAELDAERRRGIHRTPTPVEMGPFSNDPTEELRKATEIKVKQERAEVQRRALYAIAAMRDEGRNVLSVDFCADAKETEAAFRAGARDKTPTFAKTGETPLDDTPRAHAAYENPAEVLSLATARNWLPVLRSDRFGTKGKFMDAVANTNYDMVVVDVAHRSSDLLVKSDIAKLKFKKLGARRLVMAAMPIGRAYDWRWYWLRDWDVGNPAFVFAHDEPPGVFITDTGSGEWRGVLGKYLAGIMDLGFDGVMFDDVGTYLWFEDLMPLGR